jgi:hypothetical protein
MMDTPQQISLEAWEERYAELRRTGLREPAYGGPLGRHLETGGDRRLKHLKFDNSPAALRLWNFLLSEEDRLHAARAAGKKLVGTMKDLGTVPVMAYADPALVAFYPDGAWWIPCLMEQSDGLLRQADALGIDESFCPVRAMLGAFQSEAHFPRPDLLTCSVGAVCDDFSAIAQRLEAMGHPILWWEMPRRRAPEPGEPALDLPGGLSAPVGQVDIVKSEFDRLRRAFETLAGRPLDDAALRSAIRAANEIRRLLAELRRLVFTAARNPLPALEMLVAEMLAIHYCSDRAETAAVLGELVETVRGRIRAEQGLLPASAVRVFWVNPVADLRVMNLLEESGGRMGGTDYLFMHALDEIPEDLAPLDALARMALADPMVGSGTDRARRIAADVRAFGAEALLVSRIPGASHCAHEGRLIQDYVSGRLGIPTVEVEVPPVSDALEPNLRSRIEALIETARARRQP